MLLHLHLLQKEEKQKKQEKKVGEIKKGAGWLMQAPAKVVMALTDIKSRKKDAVIRIVVNFLYSFL